MTGDRMTYDQLIERWHTAKLKTRELERKNALLLSALREIAYGKYMRRANSALIGISSIAKDALEIVNKASN